LTGNGFTVNVNGVFNVVRQPDAERIDTKLKVCGLGNSASNSVSLKVIGTDGAPPPFVANVLVLLVEPSIV
jgi:hypothetical protein